MMRPMNDSIKQAIDAIEHQGYAVIQHFLHTAACSALAAECRQLHAEQRLRPAAIGRAQSRREHGDVRGDYTHWFEASALTPVQTPFWQAMQTLRADINRNLLLGLQELEAHYALYAPGARYARHRDRFRDDDARVLSSVLYLNSDWRREDGGALRLYLPDGQNPHVDIYPEAGTLVLFLSADFDHEVLPATRERLSVAGWLRRRV
jgi:SM-20-related protein